MSHCNKKISPINKKYILAYALQHKLNDAQLSGAIFQMIPVLKRYVHTVKLHYNEMIYNDNKAIIISLFMLIVQADNGFNKAKGIRKYFTVARVKWFKVLLTNGTQIIKLT